MSVSPFSSDLDRIGRWLDRSQIAYVIALAATVVLTVAIVILSKRQSILKDEEFAAYKVKAESDTRERIAQVEADSKERVARVKADSDEKIAAANMRSDEISAKANRDAEELRRQNLATESELEKERAKRADLEASISPRWFTSDHGNEIEVGTLKNFAGTKVEFDVVIDREADQAAGQLANVLKQCGWVMGDVASVFNMPAHPIAGVIVTPYRPDVVHLKTIEERRAAMQEAARLREAAESVVEFLRSHGWTAEIAPMEVVNAGTVKISVDTKPNPYFFPPELKAAMKRRNDEREEEKRRDAEFKKHREELERRLKRNE